MNNRDGAKPEEVLRDLERSVPNETFWTKTDSGSIHRIIGHSILTATGEPLVNHYNVMQPELRLSTPSRVFLGGVAIDGGNPEPLFRPTNGAFKASGN